jgi:uncharacterized protein (DUF1800 family)
MLKPLAAKDWSFTTAAHLLNRAGFGGTPQEIQALAALGPEKAVAHLVDYEKIPDPTPDPDWAKPDPERGKLAAKVRTMTEQERRQLRQEEQKLQRDRILELRYWWLQRMAHGPRPLQEKLTLFWHGHFATSVEKVRDSYLMWRQNELFRRLASGNWLQMLIEVGKDPAMLVWLDQAQSRKEHPNENFAREVMELFALGEGHYTEKDITEGARALTGWSYDRVTQKFVERPSWHDEGAKTIFGQTGNFGPEDFLEMIVAHPQASRFIVGKLWLFFAGEPASEALVEALASLFRQSGNNFKPVLRTIFQSEEFYAPGTIRNQVKSPVQWLVGTVRMLERDLPPQLVSVNLLRTLGQDLFAPPNVKGWDGGLSWITTNNLLARYNEAALLVQGDTSMLSAAMLKRNPKANSAQMEKRLKNVKMGAVQVEKVVTEKERTDKEALVAALERRLLQSRLKPRQEKVLRDFLDGLGPLDEPDILHAIRLVMSTPEYQLT